ncbi:unnamed protein product [Arabidopsis halleri]
MKLSLRFLSILLLISFMVLATTAEVSPVDNKICKTRSDRFSGVCLSTNNCAIICQQFEHFDGGHCEFDGALRRCMCTKQCNN